MKKMKFKTIGLFSISDKGRMAAEDALFQIALRGIKPVILDKNSSPNEDIDMLITFGGDGTVLLGAKIAEGKLILPVNTGKVGFLSEISYDELSIALDLIFKESFHIERHWSLLCKFMDKELYCINDCILYKEEFTSIMRCSIYVNGLEVGKIHGDGVTVCTPTGSTAYSLSAGGPVIMPDSDIMCITPISSHNLSTRPIVLPKSARISIKLESAAELSLDGIDIFKLDASDIVEIEGSDVNVKFIRFGNRNVFELIREKLTL